VRTFVRLEVDRFQKVLARKHFMGVIFVEGDLLVKNLADVSLYGLFYTQAFPVSLLKVFD
jgi:hypothetical protein